MFCFVFWGVVGGGISMSGVQGNFVMFVYFVHDICEHSGTLGTLQWSPVFISSYWCVFLLFCVRSRPSVVGLICIYVCGGKFILFYFFFATRTHKLPHTYISTTSIIAPPPCSLFTPSSLEETSLPVSTSSLSPLFPLSLRVSFPVLFISFHHCCVARCLER